MPMLEENSLLSDVSQRVLPGKASWKINSLYPVLTIIIVHVIAMSVTAVACLVTGSPFIVWFYDTPRVLLVVLLYMVFLGIVWDGVMVAVGMIFQVIRRLIPSAKGIKITVASMRKVRFFTCGLSPLLMILLTAGALLYTSNITLLNLKLLGTVTSWHDQMFWGIEGSIFKKLVLLPINADMWDKLYHSAWGIELFAAFVLVVIGRGPRIVLHYCVSMIVLFYLGRFLGVLNPVMGPAFYRPELFSYLDGSVTDSIMQSVTKLLHITPEQARDKGGMLLGGVSAMPSLHIGMVTLTAYWLAVAKRKTLFVTVPWVLLVWTSTVVLGWHYILDGLGGIVLGLLCVWVTTGILVKAGMPTRSFKEVRQ